MPADDSSSFLSVDDSPFFANAPLSLAPGQNSGPFELFAVDLATNTALGNYLGNGFEIQGGADGGNFTAFADLADATFSVTVAGSTVAAPGVRSGLGHEWSRVPLGHFDGMAKSSHSRDLMH